jgi:hypothetical protein
MWQATAKLERQRRARLKHGIQHQLVRRLHRDHLAGLNHPYGLSALRQHSTTDLFDSSKHALNSGNGMTTNHEEHSCTIL